MRSDHDAFAWDLARGGAWFAGIEVRPSLTVHCGNGLFAAQSRHVRSTDAVVSIPLPLALCRSHVIRLCDGRDDVLRRAISALRPAGGGDGEAGEAVVLSVALLYFRYSKSDADDSDDNEEKEEGEYIGDSFHFWRRYAASLPHRINSIVTIDRESDEWKLLRGTGLQSMADVKLREAEADHERASEALAILTKELRVTIDFKIFLWAYSVYWCRSISIKHPEYKSQDQRHLIPFLDMTNHSNCPQFRLSFSAGSSAPPCMQLIPLNDRRLVAGEEIFVSYGDKSNADLFSEYDFTIESNPHDVVHFGALLLVSDKSQHQSKIEMLRRLGFPDIFTLRRRRVDASEGDDHTGTNGVLDRDTLIQVALLLNNKDDVSVSSKLKGGESVSAVKDYIFSCATRPENLHIILRALLLAISKRFELLGPVDSAGIGNIQTIRRGIQEVLVGAQDTFYRMLHTMLSTPDVIRRTPDDATSELLDELQGLLIRGGAHFPGLAVRNNARGWRGLHTGSVGLPVERSAKILMIPLEMGLSRAKIYDLAGESPTLRSALDALPPDYDGSPEELVLALGVLFFRRVAARSDAALVDGSHDPGDVGNSFRLWHVYAQLLPGGKGPMVFHLDPDSEDWRLLEPTGLANTVRDDLDRLRRQYDSCRRSLRVFESATDSVLTFDDFLWAQDMMRSRCFAYLNNDVASIMRSTSLSKAHKRFPNDRRYMVPFIDMANHSFSLEPNAIKLTYEVTPTPDLCISLIVLETPPVGGGTIPADTELFIPYVRKGNAVLLHKFNFTVPDNPFDAFTVAAARVSGSPITKLRHRVFGVLDDGHGIALHRRTGVRGDEGVGGVRNHSEGVLNRGGMLMALVAAVPDGHPIMDALEGTEELTADTIEAVLAAHAEHLLEVGNGAWTALEEIARQEIEAFGEVQGHGQSQDIFNLRKGLVDVLNDACSLFSQPRMT